MKQNVQVVPKFWKNKVKRRDLAQCFQSSKVKLISVFQKFVKMKQNKTEPFKIEQERSKTNIFVSDCEEKEKRKKRSFVFFWKEAKKNENNRSSTIKDLPLLLRKSSGQCLRLLTNSVTSPAENSDE
jgi:hypothetical protein